MNIEEICVGDLMNRSVKTVVESLPLLHAARLMYETHVSSLVVEKKNKGDALGMLTRKDIVGALAIPGMESLLVRDVMTKPAITVTPDLALYHCIRLMRMTGVRRVPVVQDGNIVGILSNSDIFRGYVEQSTDQ